MEFNDISWFFYWADVIPNIGLFAKALSFMFLFIGVALSIATFAITFDSWNCYEKVGHLYSLADKVKGHENNKPISIWFPTLFTLFLLIVWLLIISVAIFTPSQDTIYKMGASVIGEHIIQLEEVQEVGGELGELAKDTINMLRSHIQDNTVGD